MVALFVSAMLGSAALTTWLKGRRAKRYETPADLRRADEAEEAGPYDAKKARERAFRVFDETAGQK
jgi:hypothetical protein